MFDISPEQRTAAEAAQKSLEQSEGGVAAVVFWGAGGEQQGQVTAYRS